MGRPRTFDRDRVVEAAMEVFWRVGYANAGVTELSEATGLGRSSLYHEFGDKAGLFEAALDTYASTLRTRLDGATSPRDALQRWFAGNAEPAGNARPAGCLIVDSLADVPALDPRVASMVHTHVAVLHMFFRDAVEATWRSAGLDPPVAPETLADSLLALHHGMNVLAASGTTPPALRRIASLQLTLHLPR